MNSIAKCQCGRLRARVAGDPLLVLICHCAACQHRTGAPFSYCAYFERSKVQLEGPSNCYEREGQEGRKLRYYFCPRCGTTVYWELDFRPDRYGIAATLFDEKSFSSPALSIWEENKCDWVVLPDGMTHLQKQPVG
jgi:hypothetical protein